MKIGDVVTFKEGVMGGYLQKPLYGSIGVVVENSPVPWVFVGEDTFSWPLGWNEACFTGKDLIKIGHDTKLGKQLKEEAV